MNINIPNKYRVFNGKKVFSSHNLLLKSISEHDIELIRIWRNNQTQILRQQEKISKEKQEEYFRKYVWNEMNSLNPKQILLSIIKNDITIGYGGFVNISWQDQRAEMSFILSDEIAKNETLYEKIFSEFIFLVQEIAFKNLNLNRIYTETYDIRPLHISILEKNKFKFEGRMKCHLIIDNKKVDSLLHGCLKDYEK